MNDYGILDRPAKARLTSRLVKVLAPKHYERQRDLQAHAVQRLHAVAIAKQAGTSPHDLRQAMRARERACEATAAYLWKYRHDVTQAVKHVFVDVAAQPHDAVALGIALGLTRAGAELAFPAGGGKRAADRRLSSHRAILETVKPLADASSGYIYVLEKAPPNMSTLSGVTNWFHIWMLDQSMWGDRARRGQDLAILGVVAGLEEHLPTESRGLRRKKGRPVRQSAAWSDGNAARRARLRRFMQSPSLSFFDPVASPTGEFDVGAHLQTCQAMVDYMQTCSDPQLVALLKTMPTAREPPAFDVRITYLGTLLNGAARRWGASASGIRPRIKGLQPEALVSTLHAVATGLMERQVVDGLHDEVVTGAQQGDTAEKIMRRMAALAAEMSYRLPVSRMERFLVKSAATGLMWGNAT